METAKEIVSDKLAESLPLPESEIVDLEDLPSRWKWSIFFVFYVGFIVLAIILFYLQLNVGLTTSFVSLDPTVGVCKEVPQVCFAKELFLFTTSFYTQ